MKVIHATEKKKQQEGPIVHEVVEELIDLGHFVDQGVLFRYEYEPFECYEPLEVVRRAKEKVGPVEYDVSEDNCEHFAHWCKNNENTSHQAEEATVQTSDFLGSASLMGLIWGLFRR